MLFSLPYISSSLLLFASLVFFLVFLISSPQYLLSNSDFEVLRSHNDNNSIIYDMSCNGCRVLRKGCSESCILRPCLQWIETPESQGHATVFVAKFFGRAGLMSFISGVPEKQRPALFQSLLFEACGRTVNPVNGAVGLLWTGNWHICQAAVETVLRGGTLQPMTEALGGVLLPEPDEVSEVQDPYVVRSKTMKRKEILPYTSDLELSLTSGATCPRKVFRNGKQRSTSPSEGSVTTTFDSGMLRRDDGEQKLLNLFV